jgi:hypothetical protein
MSAATAAPSLLIDYLEACRMLGVKPSTWRMRVQAGTAPLPHARMGSRAYYKRADVEHFAERGVWPPGMTFKGGRADG